MAALLMTLAVALDWLLGGPRRWHPLTGFGRLAAWLEHRLYPQGTRRVCKAAKAATIALYVADRWRGALAVAALLLPATLLAAELAELPDLWGAAFSIMALTFSLGHKRLHHQIRLIVTALRGGDEAAARAAAAHIVSCEADILEITPSACESVLESGNEGVFGALFWFLVAGAPGALLYRLANTLAAMWDCKNPRYLEFGWAAAQLDDMLNIVPARLTALTYALLGHTRGHTRQALECWREQAPACDNPNAGPVLAAGAGALGIRLGDRARYLGEWHERPPLGTGVAPGVADIERALALVRNGVLLWLAMIGLGALAWWSLDNYPLDWNGILDFVLEKLLA